MKLGRKRPAAPPRVKFAAHLHPPDLPTPPSSVDYSANAVSLANPYLNTTLGDCVIAGAYHVVGVATGNAGKAFIASDAEITTDYENIGGYVPGQPGTDDGCDELTAFAYWTATGFADGTKLVGSPGVNAANPSQCMQALYLFENLYFGIELPDEWITPFPDASGFVWDVAGDPNPANGHCVMAFGYDASGVMICSWGMMGKITWGAVAKYAVTAAGGELYTLVTQDILLAGQQTSPLGVNWADLLDDMAGV